MTVYLAVAHPAPSDADLTELRGPWSEIRPLAGGALLVDSDDTLSRVYHELKWSLPDGASLLVTVAGPTKLRGQPAGTQTWLRDRSAGD